jgi:hypothetical protein
MQIKTRGTPAGPNHFLGIGGTNMESTRSHSKPSDVNAEAGHVFVEGPDGVAVTLTPDAADETARRMIIAASQARSQERG